YLFLYIRKTLWLTMSYSSRRRRGSYATKACNNCRKKHIKCSEGVTCTYCASHNLQCTYAELVKKRGPKTANRAANIFGNNYYEAANAKQEHVLTPNEYQFNSIPYYLNERN
ncbi:9969_t:CDS:2, partial [Dentiscutata heterogama]